MTPPLPGATPHSQPLEVRTLAAGQALQWLRRGWADLRQCPAPGLLHGLATASFAALLIAFARDRFWLLAGAFSGFLLVAPVIATGLYQVSRLLESGRSPGWREVLSVWRPHDRRLVTFGLLLALAGTAWVLTSASLITWFAGAPVRNPQDFLRLVVLDERSMLFEIWLALGGVLAAPMFASSVVAIPLLLDRRVSVQAAVITSWRAVAQNPGPLALWAALLMTLTLVGMAALLLGLIPVVPWLAHASWHAYRDLVPAAAPDAAN